MNIVFFSNFINHHQVFVADELYRITDAHYTFVEVLKIPQWLLESGYPDFSDKPYLLQAWKNDDNYKKACKLAVEADIALFSGTEVFYLLKERVQKTNKITFDVSERWLKRGIINLASPRISRFFFLYHLFTWKNKPLYKLCSSSFTANDHKRLCMFNDKCYKWGYFTKVDENFQIEASNLNVSTSEITPVVWCARFLKWKHPELPIQLAARLIADGYNFVLDMYGSGVQLDATKRLAKDLNLDDVVRFKGNVPNEQILDAMRQHEIFLFTSDKNEGWGAVSNESMANGCVLIGSDTIGSLLFLVDDGEDGLLFKTCDLDSLYEKVKFLLDNPKERIRMRHNAVTKMQKVWSPTVAANNLLTLIDDLKHGRDTSIMVGPCSKA